MRHTVRFLLATLCLVLVGCNKRERVSTDYVLETPESLNPDGHPGTALYYRGKLVWPNVYKGYFWHDLADENRSAHKFYHDGIFAFVGPVPEIYGFNSSTGPQLYTIRGMGPPILISERIFNQALTNCCYIEHITTIPTGLHVVLRYWAASKNEVRMTNEVSWADISSWMKEAESFAPVKNTPYGNYRILPQ